MLHDHAWFWIALVIINILSGFLAVVDKVRARGRRRRIRERTLLGLALAGGSVGLVAAMIVMRHKVRKVSFVARLGVIILVQAVIAFYIAGRQVGF